MSKLTFEQEQILLHECINNGRMDMFIREYAVLIYYIVNKTIRLFPILRDKYMDKKEIKGLRNEIILQFFENDCHKLRKFKKQYNMRLASWIKMLTSRMVIDILRKEVIRLHETLESDGTQLSFNDYRKVDEQKLNHLKICIDDSFEMLSERESKIFKLSIEGYTAKEISKKMMQSEDKIYLTEDNIYQIVSRTREVFRSNLYNEN
ncbi:protein containing Transcription regulator LuxR [Candidatus Magnetomorum sp. HK-1]|nr:protein containing Transcription regulator LuxR [Candidatus Magnetomorum sp. HK-1]